jgi:predicted ATPase
MAKFELRERVRRIGQTEVRTVEEVRQSPSAETLYWIQQGRDFATRVWAKESELERATIDTSTGVIKRLYVHNFRCLENFELPVSGRSSALLIGKNGAGKTTVSLALQILQKIARNTNRVGDLVKPKDFPRWILDARGRTEAPIRFEIEVEIEEVLYQYAVAFEFPEDFREMRVREERLAVGGMPVYTREVAQVRLSRAGQEASFLIDWHLVALPIIQFKPTDDPSFAFKRWLANMLILRPTPSSITGDSDHETLQPNPQVTDFGAWFLGLLTDSPSAYTKIASYLHQVMPDLKDIKNPTVGRDARSVVVQFSTKQGNIALPFEDLSDGEKCFMICSLVLAANDFYGPLFCFWDEPDNFLALEEVGHFVVALRQAFQLGGQFIATSHNPEAIRRFSDENTLILYRNSHLEPTIARPISDLQVTGDLVNALIRGDVSPHQP